MMTAGFPAYVGGEALATQRVWAVYDQQTQQIDRVYETQRDAQTCVDEWNSWMAWDRYCLEPQDAADWDTANVWGAA